VVARSEIARETAACDPSAMSEKIKTFLLPAELKI
jgi:hypothetical protein